MNGEDDSTPFPIQFGPYHMAATLLIKTGDIPAYDQFQAADSDEGFEWPSYSLSHFKTQWPPSDF